MLQEGFYTTLIKVSAKKIGGFANEYWKSCS